MTRFNLHDVVRAGFETGFRTACDLVEGRLKETRALFGDDAALRAVAAHLAAVRKRIPMAPEPPPSAGGPKDPSQGNESRRPAEPLPERGPSDLPLVLTGQGVGMKMWPPTAGEDLSS